MSPTFSLCLSSRPSTSTYVAHEHLILPICLTPQISRHRELTAPHESKGFHIDQDLPESRNHSTEAHYHKWPIVGHENGEPFDIEAIALPAGKSTSKNQYYFVKLRFVDSQTQRPISISHLDLQLISLGDKSPILDHTPLNSLSGIKVKISEDSILVRENSEGTLPRIPTRSEGIL